MDKVYKIEQLTESGPIFLENEEIKRMEELESLQIIIENTSDVLTGIFTDEYLEFIRQLFIKNNIEFTITELTSITEY